MWVNPITIPNCAILCAMKKATPRIQLCPTCHGEKMVADPHCGLCGKRLANDPARAMGEGATLPCGHDGQHFSPKSVCIECDGNGRFHSWLTSEEARTAERATLARCIFVIGISLLLLVIFLLKLL